MESYLEQEEKGEKSFTEALLKDPHFEPARYNLAMSHLNQEQIHQAQKELDYIELSKNKLGKDSLYRLYFAKAYVHSLIKNTDAALENYQKALGFKPDSTEIKKNIEILTLQAQQQPQSGKGDKKQKDQASSDQGEGEPQDKGEKDSKNKSGKEKADQQEITGQDDKSLEKKKLSKRDVEQILKEIKKQESRVRSKENSKFKGQGVDGKNW